MRFFLTLLLLVAFCTTSAQVRARLNYSDQWELTTIDSAIYIRVCIIDTTSGSIVGPVVDMFRSGKPQMKGTYKARKKEGEFTFYFENGNIESTGQFENNQRTGLWKYYYRNGRAKMEAEFFPVLGEEPRIYFLNDSSGNVLLKNGTGKWVQEETYSHDIKISVTGEYKDYEKHGKWTFSVPSQKMRREEEFEEGRFIRGFIYRKGSAKMNLESPMDYGIYLMDKLPITENFIARPGIDFKTYPFLTTMTVNGSVIYNDRTFPIPATSVDTLSHASEIFEIIDAAAQPPNGMAEVYKFIAEVMHYPPDARRKGISGKVFVEFVVEKDGRLTNIQAVKRIGGGCDEEAVRALTEYAKQKKWSPAKNAQGEAIRSRQLVPITFKLG